MKNNDKAMYKNKHIVISMLCITPGHTWGLLYQTAEVTLL